MNSRIIEARLHEGLSQRKVADQLGKTRAWFGLVEHGRIGVRPEVEEAILALIARLGALERAAAIERRRIAADIVIPKRAPRAPAHREVRT